MRRHGSRLILAATALLLALPAGTLTEAAEKKESKHAEKRQTIDTMAREALDDVLAKDPQARKYLDDAVGYAVFDNWHTGLLISGGSGKGVAVHKGDGTRTYMKMKTFGVNLGAGVQKCQVVFMFQTEQRFRQFVDNGWAIESAAEAAAGTEGAAASAKWVDGVATWQITEGGLMARVDLTGTKYYPVKKWNR